MWLETREVFLGRKWPLYQPQNSKFSTLWTWAARTMLPMATWMTWPGKMTTVLLTCLQGHKKEKIKTGEQIPKFRFELTWKAKKTAIKSNGNVLNFRCAALSYRKRQRDMASTLEFEYEAVRKRNVYLVGECQALERNVQQMKIMLAARGVSSDSSSTISKPLQPQSSWTLQVRKDLTFHYEVK